MVQVLPEVPSFGQQFGRSFGAGLGQGASHFTQQLLKHKFEQKGKNAELDRKLAAVEQFKKTPFYEQLSPNQKLAIESEMAGLIGTGTSKSLINAERDQQANQQIENLIGGENAGPQGMGPEESGFQGEESLTSIMPEGEQEQSPIAKSKLESMNDTQLKGLLGSQNQRVRDIAKAELDTRGKQKEISHKEKLFGHKETAKYAEGLREKADQAEDIKHAANEIKKAVKKGVTGPKARNVGYKILTATKNPLADLFQNEDLQSVISAGKVFAGGFKGLMGSKPTEREFFWYENIIPGILKNAGANLKATEYFERIADLNIKQQQIADEITKKNGGFRPVNLDAQVREKMRPELEKAIDIGEKLYLEEQGAPLAKGNEGRVINDGKGNRFISTGTNWERLE